MLNARSLTEAGRWVGLSQPAMSVALRKLRDQFGDELVADVGGERRLTPLAQALRPRVRRLLRDVGDTFRLQIDFDPAVAVRTFTIAAPEQLEIMLLGRVIPDLLRAAPGVSVTVLPFTRSSSANAFETGADMLVIPQRFAVEGLQSRVLMTERPSCMVWDDHPGFGDEITPEHYLEARHVAVFERPGPNAQLDGPSRDLLDARKIAVRTSLHGALPNLVLGTDLVATASSWLLQHFASMMPLKVLSFPIATSPEPIIAQWPPHLDHDAAHAWLLEQVVRATCEFL
nr:LysR family transcriptional regulator [Sphingomonas glacialis]